jgi:pimeloyl-ACP methyl ester carboxylesterase
VKDVGYCTLADGGSIHYEIEGPIELEPPLVLVRPLGGSIALWGPFRDELAARRRVVSFDARGSGRSSPMPWPASIRSMAKDLLDLLDHLRLRQVDLFGLSLGAMVVTRFALDHENRVRRLVLSGPTLRGVGLLPRGVGSTLRFARCLLRSGADGEACLARQTLSISWPDELAADFERAIRKEARGRLELLKQLAAVATYDVRREIRRLSCPTLVVAGSHDRVVTVETQRHFAAQLTRGRFEVMRNVGHDPTIEAARDIAARILAFLEEPLVSPTVDG